MAQRAGVNCKFQGEDRAHMGALADMGFRPYAMFVRAQTTAELK